MRPKYFLTLIVVGILFCLGTLTSNAELLPETVSYSSGKHSFAGYLYKPEGKGPFPVMVWNHGHAKHLLHATSVSRYEDLARLFLSDNYVVFFPDRHMHDVNTEDYSAELQKLLKENPASQTAKDRKYLEYLEVNANDVRAALEWLRSQPYVDKDRIVISGWSSGAAAALMVVEKDPAIRACVPMSPGVTQWKGSSVLRKRLLRAVETTQVPVFMIQSRDDVTLEPMEVLGKVLEKKGGLNRAKTYPFEGKPDSQLTSIAMAGWEKWGNEVLVYFDEVMKK